jgi:hypothetical protein
MNMRRFAKGMLKIRKLYKICCLNAVFRCVTVKNDKSSPIGCPVLSPPSEIRSCCLFVRLFVTNQLAVGSAFTSRCELLNKCLGDRSICRCRCSCSSNCAGVGRSRRGLPLGVVRLPI